MNVLQSFFQSIQRRLTVLVILLVAIPITAGGILIIQQWQSSLRDQIEVLEEERVDEHLIEMQQFLNLTESDIRFLGDNPAVANLGEALLAQNENQIASLTGELQQVFLALSNSRQIYDQIRFFDTVGNEIVRVDRDIDPNAEAFVVTNLQNKADRSYYVGSVAQPENGIYVSPLNLNREGSPSQIEVLADGSLVPVLRYGTPVFVEGRRIGVVVTNVFAQPLIDLLDDQDVEDDSEAYLITVPTTDTYASHLGGYILNTLDPSREFGFETGIDTLSADNPAIDGVSDRQFGYSVTDDYITEDEFAVIQNPIQRVSSLEPSQANLTVHYARIAPSSARDYYWLLVQERDNAVLFAEINQITTFGTIAIIAVLGVVSVVATLFARQLTGPIVKLSEQAEVMAGGNLNVDIAQTSTRGDEIGDLSRSFSTMASQLKGLFGTMEDRIAARTKDLETSAEIASAANQVRETGDLLSLTVNLIRDRFDLYYVQVYLVDLEKTHAVLKDGTGFVGRKLIGRRHRLPLDGKSIVANAFRRNTPQVVADTQEDPNFLPNDLLPNTRTEVAIPLRLQDEIIGVLDMQHSIPNFFDEGAIQLFQSMADQLAVIFENVNLFQSTERRAAELETVAKVSSTAATILDTDKMLREVVTLTRDSFSLYHAHIYILSDDGQMLNLAAGAGEPGRIMIDHGHSIPFDREHSLVARAARSQQGVIVNNTEDDPDFLPNELLPETRSEMAIPMVVGDKLIGVLDVQSTENDRFTAEDVQVKTTLAAQVAVAVENARAFARVEEARAEVDRVFKTSIDMLGSANTSGHFTTLNEAWTRTLGWSREELMAEPFISFVHPDDVELTTEAATKIFGGLDTVTFENRYRTKSGEYRWVAWNTASDPENNLVHFVARDVTEQKRSEQEIQKRANEMEVVAKVSAEASTVLDVDELLWDVTQLTRDSFDLYHAHIYLLNDAGDTLVLTAGAGEAGKAMVAEHRIIPFDAPQSLVAHAARDRAGVIVNDVTANPDFLPHPMLPETKSEMAIPMIVGDKLVGVLDVQASITDRFTHEDVRVKTTLASQIAIAIQNARSFESSQKQARELEIVSDVSAKISETLDPDQLVTDVARITAESFDLYHIHLYIVDETGDNLLVVAGNGKAPCRHVGNNYMLSIQNDDTPVTIAARTLKAQVDNNVSQDHNLDFNPFLPETKAQLAIPIVSAGQLIGVMETHENYVDAFDASDVRVKSILAEQIAVAIQNARSFALVEKAQKAAQDLQDAVDESAIVAITNVRGEITYVNDKFCEISKWDREDLIGQDHRIINSGYHSEDFIKNVWVTIANGGVWQGEFQNKAKDGSIYWVDTTIVPFMNEAGKPYQYVAIRYDITARKIQEAEIQKRANEMEVVAKVSAEASTVLDVDRLLWDVTQLTRDSFNLYHAHVYLLNRAGDLLELVAGAGEAGKKMVAEHRVIPFDSEQSIVARTARERQGVIVNDVTANPDFLPHPMLPDTKSEMAIPMIVGDELIGVLDVQASITDRFTEEDVRIKTTLASQVAVAVQNARSFEQTRLRLRDMQLSNRISDIIRAGEAVDLTLENTLSAIISALDADNAVISRYSVKNDMWHGYIGAGTDMSSEIARTFVDPGPTYPHGLQAIEQRNVEAVDNAAIYPDFPKQFIEESIGIKSVLVIPLFENNDPFGVIFVNFVNHQHIFSAEELALARSISNQVSLNLDRVALNDAIAKRAQELATVAEVSTATTTILNVDDLLQSVVELTRDRFALYHAQIYLVDGATNRLVLAAGSGEAGSLMLANNHAISLDNEHSTVIQAVKRGEGVISNNTHDDAYFLPNPLLPDTKAEMSIPIRVGGDIIGVLDVQADITDRFTDEDVQIKSTLADQVAVAIRNAQLFAETQAQAERERENAERLREVDRLKSQFLANMSHELRTPLNSIIGYSEVLLDGVDGELNEDAEEDVEAIHSSGKHLLSIINEILDLAKIEAGEMQLDRKDVDIVDFCKEIIRNGQMLVKNKDVELALIQEDDIPMIYADPVRLRQIIWNLISNATKFTEQGSVIVRLNRENDDYIGIAVEDSGVGMSQEGLALIFERFSQVDGSSTRRAGGTGLGLTITRQLIEMHGGEINVSSVKDEGSTFFITLPVKVNEPAKSTSNGLTK